MNSWLWIVLALLLVVAITATEVKRAKDQRMHWESGDHDWSKK